MLTNQPICDFAKLLASDAPVPGGGGAAAVIGALGAATGAMAGELTLNKPKYADRKALLEHCTAVLADCRERLLALTEADAEAFSAISAVYKLKKDDPARPTAMEQALHQAVMPPFEMLQILEKTTEILTVLFDQSSPMMISDVGTGAAAVLGALKGAALNVFVNTGAMTDGDLACNLEAEADRIVNRCTPELNRIWEGTLERIRKTRGN